MTNCETFYDADRECANMFPPQCGAGGICGKQQLSSLPWRQLDCWRLWQRLAELNGAITDRTVYNALCSDIRLADEHFGSSDPQLSSK
jgi:hypothetical protein